MDNWYLKAQKSKDANVVKLLEKYKGEQDDDKKKSIAEALKIYLAGEQEIKEEVKEEAKPETLKRDLGIEEITPSYILGLHSKEGLQEVILKAREKIESIENARLKKEKWQDKLKIEKEIWSFRRLEYLSRSRINEIKRAEKEEAKRKETSQIAAKRARFVALYKKGFSFTNICTHPDGVKKSELLEIVNEDVVKSCSEADKYFIEHWDTWSKKNLKGD